MHKHMNTWMDYKHTIAIKQQKGNSIKNYNNRLTVTNKWKTGTVVFMQQQALHTLENGYKFA